MGSTFSRWVNAKNLARTRCRLIEGFNSGGLMNPRHPCSFTWNRHKVRGNTRFLAGPRNVDDWCCLSLEALLSVMGAAVREWHCCQ